jgi:hypothetical protein
MGFIALCLATLYVVYLMTKADITTPLRSWVADQGDFWLRLLSCPYCSALWAGLFTYALYLLHDGLATVLALAGAVQLLWPLWERLTQREKENVNPEPTDVYGAQPSDYPGN